MLHSCARLKCTNPRVSRHFTSKNYVHQKFSLPFDVMGYVLRKLRMRPGLIVFCWQLYHSCKYFHTKIKIIPCWSLEIHDSEIRFCLTQKTKCTKERFLASDFKFFVHHEVTLWERSNMEFFLSVSPRIILGIRGMSLRTMTLRLAELSLLSRELRSLELFYCDFEDSDGVKVSLDRVFKEIHYVIEFAL